MFPLIEKRMKRWKEQKTNELQATEKDLSMTRNER
jgi:hypothetical protein